REVAELLARERNELEALHQLLHRGAGGTVQTGVDAQVLFHGEAPVHQGLRGREPDPAERGLPVSARCVPEERDRPRRGHDESQQDVDRGRLAPAVRAEETDDLTRAHRERQACEGQRAGKPLVEIADLDWEADGTRRLGRAPAFRRKHRAGCRGCRYIPGVVVSDMLSTISATSGTAIRVRLTKPPCDDLARLYRAPPADNRRCRPRGSLTDFVNQAKTAGSISERREGRNVHEETCRDGSEGRRRQ